MKTTLLLRLALATACAVSAAAAAQARIVAEPEMAAFCTGEAAAKLGTRPRNILTLPVEKTGGKYIVYGQSPADGADVTTFECTFGSDRKYSGIKITGRPAGGESADNGGAPPAAMAACKGKHVELRARQMQHFQGIYSSCSEDLCGSDRTAPRPSRCPPGPRFHPGLRCMRGAEAR